MIQFTEAIKLKDGVLHNLEYHQKRANHTTCKFFQKEIDLSTLVQAIPENARSGLYKCRVLYSDRIENIEFIPYSFREIKTVGIVVDNTINYSHKYADRQQLNALLETLGYDDIIIVKDGFVTDSSAANLVFESAGTLFTPKTYLLAGIKRQFLIDKGIIKEMDIPMSDIKKFDKIHFINAMIDLEDEIGISTSSLKNL